MLGEDRPRVLLLSALTTVHVGPQQEAPGMGLGQPHHPRFTGVLSTGVNPARYLRDRPHMAEDLEGRTDTGPHSSCQSVGRWRAWLLGPP